GILLLEKFLEVRRQSLPLWMRSLPRFMHFALIPKNHSLFQEITLVFCIRGPWVFSIIPFWTRGPLSARKTGTIGSLFTSRLLPTPCKFSRTQIVCRPRLCQSD